MGSWSSWGLFGGPGASLGCLGCLGLPAAFLGLSWRSPGARLVGLVVEVPWLIEVGGFTLLVLCFGGGWDLVHRHSVPKLFAVVFNYLFHIDIYLPHLQMVC